VNRLVSSEVAGSLRELLLRRWLEGVVRARAGEVGFCSGRTLVDGGFGAGFTKEPRDLAGLRGMCGLGVRLGRVGRRAGGIEVVRCFPAMSGTARAVDPRWLRRFFLLILFLLIPVLILLVLLMLLMLLQR